MIVRVKIIKVLYCKSEEKYTLLRHLRSIWALQGCFMQQIAKHLTNEPIWWLGELDDLIKPSLSLRSDSGWT